MRPDRAVRPAASLLSWERAFGARLRLLLADERRFVWRAATSALRNLARRRPKEVRPKLLAWRDDPARLAAAETALALA